MDKLSKLEKKFKLMKEDVSRWQSIQHRFVSEFTSASSIIASLPVIRDPNNYVNLENYENFQDKVVAKQMDTLHKTIGYMNQTMDEFGRVIASFEKIVSDGRQLVSTEKNLKQRIGVYSSLAYCMEKLEALCDMHKSEYKLKSSLLEALWSLMFKPNAEDLSALQQILIDQPNIPRDEVDSIFDNLIFPVPINP